MRLETAELFGFDHVALSDSYVLDITVKSFAVTIDLEAALTGEHPMYQLPPENDAFCFRRATINFGCVRRVHWIMSETRPARDKTGVLDYGEVDSFLQDHSTFELQGDFGHLTLEASHCELLLE
jgi:hypothetical protein